MAGKKSFVGDLNPALAFINTEEAETSPKPEEEPTHFVFHTPERETKSRRVQMLIKPSTYDRLKKQADAAGASVNAYINAILEYHTGGKSK